MAPPVDLEHVPPPPWLGESLSGVPHTPTGEADGIASGSDVGGLASDMGGMGDAGNTTFNITGAWGTATSQYHQSLMDSQTRWAETLRVLESIAAAYADMQLGQINPLVPVLDRFALKPLARRAGFDFSIADNVAATIRAVPVLLVAATGRHQELARLRARAEMREMGSLAKGMVELANWFGRLMRRAD